MAKPIAMFQGPAPDAMSMMGRGLTEAGANIGRTLQQGYESLGQGIGAGIQKAGKNYEDYQSAKATNSAVKSLLSNEATAKQIFGVSGQGRVDMLSQLNSAIDQHGQLGGMKFSQALMSPLQEYAMLGMKYKQQMELQKSQEAAAMARLQEELSSRRTERLYNLLNATPSTGSAFDVSEIGLSTKPSKINKSQYQATDNNTQNP